MDVIPSETFSIKPTSFGKVKFFTISKNDSILEILETKGTGHLVVTHKSILRAMLCTALGLPTSSFRAIDINNGGICVFRSLSFL